VRGNGLKWNKLHFQREGFYIPNLRVGVLLVLDGEEEEKGPIPALARQCWLGFGIHLAANLACDRVGNIHVLLAERLLTLTTVLVVLVRGRQDSLSARGAPL